MLGLRGFALLLFDVALDDSGDVGAGFQAFGLGFADDLALVFLGDIELDFNSRPVAGVKVLPVEQFVFWGLCFALRHYRANCGPCVGLLQALLSHYGSMGYWLSHGMCKHEQPSQPVSHSAHMHNL